VYSADDGGGYCKFCVLFGKFSDKRINALGVLIEQPLTTGKRLVKSVQLTFLGQWKHWN